jgi:amino acid adenylation domain-containing protein
MTNRVDQMFRRVVGDFPDRRAALGAGAEQSYRGLDAAVNSVAGALEGARGEAVCVLTGKGVRLATALLAAFRASAVYVPLDPADPSRRLAELVDRVRPLAIVTTPEYADRAALLSSDQVPRMICLDHDGTLRYVRQGTGTGGFRHSPCVAGLTGEPAYVFFTSGSTGTPRAVVGSDRSLADFLDWEARDFGIIGDDLFSQLGAIGSDASLKDILVPLTCGAAVAFPPNAALQGGALGRWAAKTGISVLGTVPSLFRTLLVSVEAEPALVDRLSRLRLVLLAGEVVRPDWLVRWTDLFGPRCPILNLYGATEATVFSVWTRLDRQDADRPRLPVGRPRRGFEIRVLNRASRHCVVGELGEIHLASDYLSLGYLGDDAATADRFGSAADGCTVYRTGDIGRMREDGQLEFVGRQDNEVKIRGTRVDLGDIEAQLAALSGVSEAVVLTDTDRNGDLCLVAHVLESGPDPLDIAATRAELARRLPRALVPGKIHAHGSFPQTHTGKIDRRALQSLTAASALPPPPTWTATEARLAAIWGELLGRVPSSREDDFFALGGHSLLAMQLQARLDPEFGVRLGLTEIFAEPRLGQMADALARLPHSEPVTADAVQDEGDGLSSGQRRLWFLNQLALDSDFYNLRATFRLRGSLDRDLLRSALVSLYRRHDQLRTAIQFDGDRLRAVAMAAVMPEARFDDLTHLPHRLRETAAIELAEREIARPFDLTRGELLRLTLIALAPDEHLAVVAMHHICGDMWSCAIIARDLSEYYSAAVENRSPALPALEASYADHVRIENAWLRGEAAARITEHWKTVLADAPIGPALPREFALTAARSFRGGQETLVLSRDVGAGIVAFARERAATPFMVMLAALSVVLRHRGGGDDLLIGTDVAGRARPELEQVVGFFVDQLPLRCDLSGDPSFDELVARLRAASLSALDHQGLPFDQLVRCAPRRADPVTPLFTVKIVGQTGPQPELALAGLHATPLALPRMSAQIDLTLRFRTDRTTGDAIEAEYASDLFGASTIRELLHQIEGVLTAALRDPATRVDDLSCGLDGAVRPDWAEIGRASPALTRFARNRSGA